MSQVTPPSSWALLLYACAERTSPFYPFSFSRLLLAAEMPPDAGHGKRESAPATISGYHVFPCPQTVLPCFCQTGHGRQDRLKTCAVGRKLATASHARMTMTVAGLLSRRQESGAFPCPLRRPLNFPVARCAILYASPFSFPPLQQVCRYSHAAIPDGISGHFRCRGKGKDGIRNTNFLATISTLRKLR